MPDQPTSFSRALQGSGRLDCFEVAGKHTYLIGIGGCGMSGLARMLSARGAIVSMLTNSLESARGLLAHAGYSHFRRPMLDAGVHLYEARALLGNSRGSGETRRLTRFGNYGLHAKLFVFDRQRIFIGSMNFDRRSKRLNTSSTGRPYTRASVASTSGVGFDLSANIGS